MQHLSSAHADVVIAWDGSRSAQDLIDAALPDLASSRSVTLLQSRRRSGPLAEDVAAYLQLHGVHTRVERARHSRLDALARRLGLSRARAPLAA